MYSRKEMDAMNIAGYQIYAHRPMQPFTALPTVYSTGRDAQRAAKALRSEWQYAGADFHFVLVPKS